MAAARQSAGAFDGYEFEERNEEFREGRIEVGKTSRCSLPPVPPGRAKTVFERPTVLHGQVRD
jgi:hypothetical protein